MFDLWQRSEDIPFWVQLFLLGFVLLGIAPFFQKVFSRIDEFLQALKKMGKPDSPASGPTEHGAETAADPFSDFGHLNEYEYIVFRRLATAGKKGLSLRAIAEGLHMGKSRVEKRLQSLADKGLIDSVGRMLFFKRYYLTPRGHDYALEQGFIVRLHRTGSR